MGESKEKPGSVEKIEGSMCDHPTLRPTEWNQSKPEPCRMTVLCDCGWMQHCPICGQPDSGILCECMKKRMSEILEEAFPELIMQ